MKPSPYPEEPWRFENMQTIPWLEAGGWSGLDPSLEKSLYTRQGLWRALTSPSPAGHVLQLILVANEEEPRNRADMEFALINIGPGLTIEELYPAEHELFPQDVREPLETLRGGMDYLLHFLEEHGWPNPWEELNDVGMFEHFPIKDPNHCYGPEPEPGETPEEYYDRLLYGDEDGHQGLSTDFVRDEDGAWFARGGGDQCFGQELCKWHNDMDRIYAAGSSTIAGHKVPLDVLEDAIALMRRNAQQVREGRPGCKPDPFNAAHAEALADVMQAALDAKPSEEVQYVE